MVENSTIKFKREKIEHNSKVIKDIVDELVRKYNKDLDEYITNIKEIALPQKDKLTDFDVERMVLKIPIYMYYSATGLEDLGVEQDNAEAIHKSLYNDAFQSATGTIRDKEAIAELAVMEDYMIEQIFKRAYKKLKIKIEMADKIYSGVKKILSKRMSDNDLTRMAGNAGVDPYDRDETR